jgi:hypothetical protein
MKTNDKVSFMAGHITLNYLGGYETNALMYALVCSTGTFPAKYKKGSSKYINIVGHNLKVLPSPFLQKEALCRTQKSWFGCDGEEKILVVSDRNEICSTTSHFNPIPNFTESCRLVGTTLTSKLHARRDYEQTEFGEFLLPFGPESFVFLPAV